MAIKATKAEECVCEEGQEDCPCMALTEHAKKVKVTIKAKPIVLKKATLIKKAKKAIAVAKEGSKEIGKSQQRN